MLPSTLTSKRKLSNDAASMRKNAMHTSNARPSVLSKRSAKPLMIWAYPMTSSSSSKAVCEPKRSSLEKSSASCFPRSLGAAVPMS